MPKWLRKSLVVLVTVLTFGIVTPSQAFELLDDKPPKRDAFESKGQEQSQSVQQKVYGQFPGSEEDVLHRLIKDAETYSYTKFGNRIGPVIEDEFREIILPNIEKAIEEVAVLYNGSNMVNLVISERPTGGESEKIFHIADRKTREDIIRFHVRRDHPPQAGYWFNFHYHTFLDQFESHHDLGSIYWDKNTPPKWMS